MAGSVQNSIDKMQQAAEQNAQLMAAWRMSLPVDLATSPPAALAPLTVCVVEAAPWIAVEACMLAAIS